MSEREPQTAPASQEARIHDALSRLLEQSALAEEAHVAEPQPRPGEIPERGVRWDASGVTVGERHIPAEALGSAQLSRSSHKAPSTRLRRFLGLDGVAQHWAHLELRTRGGLRLRVSARVDADAVRGLPWKTLSGAHVDVTDLVALLQTARAAGAQLAEWSTPDDAHPHEIGFPREGRLLTEPNAEGAEPDPVTPERQRIQRALERTLGADAFRPPAEPEAGLEPSDSPDRVESAREDAVDDWEDEWHQPATDSEPWTAPEVERATWLRRDKARGWDWIGLLVVFVGCCALYLPFVGDFGLWDPWETHYGEVSRHMTETQDYISPWWGSHWQTPSGGWEGKGFFSKPILVLWSMAIGLDVWGWGEFGIRIGVALMALLGVCLTFMMGAAVWNRRTGFIMAGVMATTPFYFFLGRQTQTDMPFVGMLLAAMCLFMMGAYGRDRRKPADTVHYGVFFATLLALVLPQLVIIGIDEGFSEEQRAMRPGLRAQSMNDYKGQDVMESTILTRTPHLSPAEYQALEVQAREAVEAQIGSEGLTGAPRQAAYEERFERVHGDLVEAANEANTPAVPDRLLELIPPILAVLFAIAAIIGIVVMRLRRRLDPRMIRGPGDTLSWNIAWVLCVFASLLMAASGFAFTLRSGAWHAISGVFGVATLIIILMLRQRATRPGFTLQRKDLLQLAIVGAACALIVITAFASDIGDAIALKLTSAFTALTLIGLVVTSAQRVPEDTERDPASERRAINLALLGAALVSLILSLGLHIKRLYDAFGANWESGFGAAFNLIKFSGIAMTAALLIIVASAALGVWKRAERRDRGNTIAAVAVLTLMLISPLLLVLKSKALGLNGTTYWDQIAYGVGDAILIVLRSVYAPLLAGVFAAGAGFLFFARDARFWQKRKESAALFAPAFIALAAVIYACVSVFYLPAFFEGKLSTFGKVAGRAIGTFFQWGPTQIIFYLLCMALLALSLATSKRKTVGQMCFLGFYIFAALATLAKGLLGFALPGAIIMFYLICTVEWKRLLEFEIPRGLLVFIAVALPWYAAMLILHENAYFQRFFVHDHFKRLSSGVHQIDSGTFEHFVKWLGYGLFPWVALVPAAIARLGSGRGLLLRDDRSRATLLIAIWATFAFTLFSLSSTKFHHYIFPAIPPLSILVALLLADLSDGRMKRFAPLAFIGFAILGLLTWDLYQDPQHWKNLFTYKYSRGWIDRVPEFEAVILGEPRMVRGSELHAGFQYAALVVGLIAAVGLAFHLFANRWLRRIGLVILLGAGAGLTVWGLNVYMPGIAPTWSQRGIWMSYWNTCNRTEAPPNADPKKIWCEESSLVYRITWRGEHYYSQNESIPLQSDDDFKHFVKQNGETPFYIMTDRARYCLGSEKTPNFFDDCKANGSIVSEVKKHYPGKPVDHELTWGDNLKFILIKFYPNGRPAGTPLTGELAREANHAGDAWWVQELARRHLTPPPEDAPAE